MVVVRFGFVILKLYGILNCGVKSWGVDLVLPRSEVERVVRDIIVNTLMLENVPPESLSLHDEDFLTAVGANSIDILELMISVEEHFNFEFGDDQLRPDLLRTLDQFISTTCERIESVKRSSHSDDRVGQGDVPSGVADWIHNDGT
jgi:acyl carrier protein